jgi:hypothetical protein
MTLADFSKFGRSGRGGQYFLRRTDGTEGPSADSLDLTELYLALRQLVGRLAD